MNNQTLHANKYPKLTNEFVKGCFFGMATGGALGLPVEFKLRSDLERSPITTMIGNGTWNQPAGTWSDATSLAFCLAESLSKGSYDLKDIADTFLRWNNEGYWAAHHEVFDIGNTTFAALRQYDKSHNPRVCGVTAEESNCNGSLMLIAPAGIYFGNESDENLYQVISEISAITHAHPISMLSCFIFSHLISCIIKGNSKLEAFETTISVSKSISYYKELPESLRRYISRVLTPRVITKSRPII